MRIFKKTWGAIVFQIVDTKDRAIITSLGASISEYIHPKDNHNTQNIIDLVDKSIQTKVKSNYQGSGSSIDIFSIHKRVQQQINAVIESIQSGHDSKANKILRELVAFQKNTPGSEEFIVKTLCNIAKKSSEKFRYDYENKCLSIALEINPSDNWTLIQYADHLKRVGEPISALRVVGQAKENYSNDISLSLEADIYSEIGEYDKALEIYKSINDWNSKHRVVNAVADIQRRIGNYDVAEKMYIRILNNNSFKDDYDDYFRAHVGLAEIKKQNGNLNDAIQYYKNIIDISTNEVDKYYYRLGVCNILKLKGEYEESFKYNEDNITKFPFASQPKFIRTSLLSLMSKNDEAISYLHTLGSVNFQKWLYQYYQGLMLLKLDRNQDAKSLLVDNINNLEITTDEKVLLRFGATLASLSLNDVTNASAFLSGTTRINSYYLKYLQLVLNLHLAALKSESSDFNHILSKINSLSIDDNDMKTAINAIKNQDYKTAILHQVNFLLKLAA